MFKTTLRHALQHRGAKPVLWLLCLMPLAWLVGGAVSDALGANPAEYVIRATGDWTLRLLCVTLAVTPMRVMLGLPELARFRRMLGLFTYFYVALHLLGYSWLDMGFEWSDIATDIAKRPFIWLGFSAAHAAGVDIVQPRHSLARCQALAGLASTCISCDRVGGAALFLDACGQA